MELLLLLLELLKVNSTCVVVLIPASLRNRCYFPETNEPSALLLPVGASANPTLLLRPLALLLAGSS